MGTRADHRGCIRRHQADEGESHHFSNGDYRELSIDLGQIRGAPAIASLAALTVAYVLRQALASGSDTPATASAYQVPALTQASAVRTWLAPALDYLQSSRPTAVNLSEAMNRIRAAAAEDRSSGASEGGARELAERIVAACEAVHANDLERNKEMGRLGAEWLWARRRGGEGQKKLRVMTVRREGSHKLRKRAKREWAGLQHGKLGNGRLRHSARRDHFAL